VAENFTYPKPFAKVGHKTAKGGIYLTLPNFCGKSPYFCKKVRLMAYIKYIQDEDHYSEVIEKVASVKNSLWIGTADIKGLHVKVGNSSEPFLSVLADLLKRGVDVRLIHAKEPGPIFREEFDKYPILAKRLERALCPRVHFKMMIFDLDEVYIGSANLTGAGIGMKSAKTRNFEAGILTTEPELVEKAIQQFDDVWMGSFCKECKRKDFCPDPIV
jgi:phosphatidylserine/phosphatidylglycerophosphate/cardiolipin synthase-like enzyme